MIEHLKRLAFEFDPPLAKHADTDREDRTKNYLEGMIDAKKAMLLLDHPVVQTILLIPFAPEEFKLPDGPDDPVMVRLELGGNLPADRQRELANQTRVLLREFGFKEPAGYDKSPATTGGPTRVSPARFRANLNLLQRDLRNHPAGWVGSVIPRRAADAAALHKPSPGHRSLARHGSDQGNRLSGAAHSGISGKDQRGPVGIRQGEGTGTVEV